MKSRSFTSRVTIGAALSSTVLTLSACGGGGGSPTPTPAPAPPANNAPQITSAASATVAENSTGTLLTLSASDADGDAVSFSISGGTDAASFSLSGGELSFAENPNFDAYADADEDNVFLVTVQASDGRGGVVTQEITITVTNDREGIAVRRVATGFDRPTGMSLFFTQTLLIAEQDGTIISIDPIGGNRQVFDDLNLPVGHELIDIASDVIGGTILSPVGLVRDNTGISLVSSLGTGATGEFKVATGAPDGARGTIGYLTGNGLGTNGLLLIAIGDPNGQLAQTVGGYGSAAYLNLPDRTSTAADLIQLGVGLRNPSSVFNFGDDFFIADQGGNEEHELSSGIPQNSGSQVNFGWPFVEGTVTVASGAPANLTAPSFTYAVGSSARSGQAITGGISLVGGAFVPPSLTDRIIVGDANGSIFTFGLTNAVPAFENRSADLVPDVGTIDSVVDIVRDAGGRTYILDSDGELFLIEEA